MVVSSVGQKHPLLKMHVLFCLRSEKKHKNLHSAWMHRHTCECGKKRKKQQRGKSLRRPSAWEQWGHGAGIDLKQSINSHAQNPQPRWRRTNRPNRLITSASPQPDSEEDDKRRNRTFLTHRPDGLWINDPPRSGETAAGDTGSDTLKHTGNLSKLPAAPRHLFG